MALFVCLFVLRLNVPVNNFSVMSGRSKRFLGLTSTVGRMCLAEGHNTMTPGGGGSNQGPLDSQSDVLLLRHRATSYGFGQL